MTQFLSESEEFTFRFRMKYMIARHLSNPPKQGCVMDTAILITDNIVDEINNMLKQRELINASEKKKEFDNVRCENNR